MAPGRVGAAVILRPEPFDDDKRQEEERPAGDEGRSERMGDLHKLVAEHPGARRDKTVHERRAPEDGGQVRLREREVLRRRDDPGLEGRIEDRGRDAAEQPSEKQDRENGYEDGDTREGVGDAEHLTQAFSAAGGGGFSKIWATEGARLWCCAVAHQEMDGHVVFSHTVFYRPR